MKCIFPLLAFLAVARALPAADLYVAPDGRDDQPGTAAAPLQTLAAARDAARKVAGREAVTVHVADGVYYLPETLVFSAADSGAAGKPVIYRADREGGAVISGGQKLPLAWTPYRDGIFQADVPAGLAIDQLFVNGQRQRMARYPNHDANQPTAAYQGHAADAFAKERAARWADPTGGYIHAMHVAHWGGYHYRITGKKADGNVAYEGGWQNNRQMGMHKDLRMVENIFEELDASGEWFHDAKANRLYYQPATGRGPRARDGRGGAAAPPGRVPGHRGGAGPVRHPAGLRLPPRGPHVHGYQGAAAALRLDGLPRRRAAVQRRGGLRGAGQRARPAGRQRDLRERLQPAPPRGGLRHPRHRRQCGRLRGPAGSGPQSALRVRPAPGVRGHRPDARAEGRRLSRGLHGGGLPDPARGEVEKQATGVQVSMAQGITIRHCSIYDMSRAGINISEGTFGGHLIEFCDVFDTVKETGDHGSFNSWGRDRFWGLKNAPPGELPKLALLDAVKPSVIRNSRWRCDHGWDVDLDDGSSNYQIYNNLFLRGGLKLREGFHRRVWNNIAVNNSLHPHVWYDDSGDIVTNNIWMSAYKPAGGMPKGKWGRELNRNLFTTEADRKRFADHGCDAASVVGDPMFMDPAAGDFRVKPGSPALKLGFKNFPMDQFGVMKPALRAKARTPEIPALGAAAAAADTKPAAGAAELVWLGASLHGLQGEEFSAFGVSREEGGVQLTEVPATSAAAAAGLQKDDLVQAVNGRGVKDAGALIAAVSAAGAESLQLRVVRGQKAQTLAVAPSHYVQVESAATLVPPPASTARATANRSTANDPLAVLTDGQLARGYGPVFPNGVTDGAYKLDLGAAQAVTAVRSWSFDQNGNRGRQLVTVYGSAAAVDPGWNTADRAKFTPLGSVDTAGTVGGDFTAASLRARDGKELGSFRWIIWRVQPVTGQAENTAVQELSVDVRP
jgi:hypothetical protein